MINPTIEYRNAKGDVLGFRQMGNRLSVTATTFRRPESGYGRDDMRWISLYVQEKELLKAVHSAHGDEVRIVHSQNTLYYIHIHRADEESVYINIGGVVWKIPIKSFDEMIRQSHLTAKELFEEKHKNDVDQRRKD